MQTQTIALIDDDRNILTSISIALEKEGFKVQTYIDGESALIGLTRNPPDLAVIDIKMPKMDGEELLKKLRKKTSLPVIFLTSKDDEIDELLSLKLGADDFIKKSGGFSIKVLIERIRVQLRKKDINNNLEDTKNIISHGKIKLDPSQLECEWDSKQLPDKLTTTEFLIVKELAKRPGIIKERAQLMDIAYREDTDIEDRTIDSHVKRIRKKFKKIDKDFLSASINENEVLDIIKEVHTMHNIVLDPHSAIGFGALKKVNIEGNNIVLATAHPCKFPEAIDKSIGIKPDLPDELKYVINEKENYDIISNNLSKTQQYIKEKI